ncbi:S1 family peptidase [Columbia Basin potato purple top phytoplasma]|uniref:Trypsin-like peptidase domain-containing protein n=1 Tax=Columbia Basin potato purple top phytoplasma TaxID=307134 RepID=A0ABT5L8C1_9MOLU|nr:serine protease [Columbia Basin potato purple top phytoplasma]MDC9031910.1 trypsin-like peptidase domain-containing protein [Columbia Basin potato purple top phytoplasma]
MKKINNIYLFFIKNIKLSLLSFFIILLFYYKYLFNQNQIIQNDYKKNQITLQITDKDLKEKNKILEEVQKKIQNIFDVSQEKPSFVIKPHKFNKGDIVYAFTLNTLSNIKPFQEGIISANYNLTDTDYLPISIKGKNNKIFFNTKGEFIGISLPHQDPNAEINHIITSNSIFYFTQCKKIQDELKSSTNKNVNTPNKYYFFIEFDENIQKNKYKIFLNQEGFFLGLYNLENPQTSVNYILEYLLFTYCKQQIENKILNTKTSEILDETNNPINKHILNLNKITFLIKVNSSLNNIFLNAGSGFIFFAEEIKQKNNDIIYNYYVLTNRHVLQIIMKNPSIQIELLNIYFHSKGELLGFINNNDSYDDIAILTFQDKDPNKFQEIQTIIKKVLPPKKINVVQGETVYSMGSQMSHIQAQKLTFDDLKNYFSKMDSSSNEKSYLEFNLLKKGNIVYFNEKEIAFDIQIDNGNSGGPVFNIDGEIIGMNKSVLTDANDVPDKISQCINIEHIKQICNKIIKLHKKNPITKFFQISSENFDYLKNELNSFLPFSETKILPGQTKNNITISIQELLNYFKNTNTKSISSHLIKEEKDIKLNIKLIIIFHKQEEIFYLNPKEEKIKIIYNENKNEIIFQKKNQKNLSEFKFYNINNIRFHNSQEPFLSLELTYPHKTNNENNIINQKHNVMNLQKIKNSLIIWKKNEIISGNGIIFQKKALSHDRFLYFVLSTYTHYNNKFISIIESIKNIFSNEVEITTFYDENYKKEKGEIKSFLFDNNNLLLLNFESSNHYDIVPTRDVQNLNLGEEVFFLINNNNDYFPQMFKGVVSYKTQDFFLCDSVFNLNQKNKTANPKLNFLYFDNEGHFIGVNKDIKETNLDDDVLINFNKVSLFKNIDIVNLLQKGKLKESFSLIFSCTFIIITIFLFIHLVDLFNKLKLNYS